MSFTRATGRRCRLRVSVAVGVIAALAGVSRHGLSPAFASLRHPRWFWVADAIGAEAISMGAFARTQRRTLAQDAVTIAHVRAVGIAYAANAVSVTVPLAGTTTSTACTAMQYNNHGAAHLITWTLATAGPRIDGRVPRQVPVGARANHPHSEVGAAARPHTRGSGSISVGHRRRGTRAGATSPGRVPQG